MAQLIAAPTKEFEKESLYHQFSSRDFQSKKDQILLGLGMDLRLSSATFAEVKDKYEGLKPILMRAPKESIIHNVDIDIFAQGSMASHTSIKCPEAKVGKKHDLDSIIRYNIPLHLLEMSPYSIVKETYDALSPHVERFNLGLILKDRCVSLIYKELCIDLLPSIPQEFGSKINSKLWIPEKVSGHTYRLSSSNPLGLQDIFEASAKREFFSRQLFKMAMNDSRTININELPDPDDYPGILRLCVILFKRARDNYFPDVILGRKAVKSILFTAFFAQKYSGQRSLIETLDALTADLYQWVHTNGNHINFANPADEGEDLGTYLREDPEKLKSFRDFISFVRQQVVQLKSCQFIDEYTSVMNALFGKELVKKQIDLIQSDYGKKQASNGLLMNSAGMFSANGAIPSPRTHFHGDK